MGLFICNNYAKLISTFFYIGYLPFAPGSAASIIGGFLYLCLSQYPVLYVFLFVLITIAGFMLSGQMEEAENFKDPSCVVIDEVSGVMIAFYGMPITPAVLVTAFFLFRAFDMFKIYPANKFENITGGAGIMLDDIMAGIYTNFVMHAAIRLAGLA